MIESEEFRLKAKASLLEIDNGTIDGQNGRQPAVAQIEEGAGDLTPEIKQTLEELRELRNEIEETKHRHEQYLAHTGGFHPATDIPTPHLSAIVAPQPRTAPFEALDHHACLQQAASRS